MIEENLPPKPETDPVMPVTDDEMTRLEQEGGQDVAFMQPDVAQADPTVDDQENDVPPEAPVSPNDPTDDIVVEGEGPDEEPDDPIRPVEQEQPVEDNEGMEPTTTAPESFEADPNDDGIDPE